MVTKRSNLPGDSWRAAARCSRLGKPARAGHIFVMDERDAKPEAGKPALPAQKTAPGEKPPREIGGPAGPEPTRYGDWERNGRCTDF
jgi:hypothetical protein